jgi:uncharacterized membrane protein
MSDKTTFFYAGRYDSLSSAEADFEMVKTLHANGDLGTYDAAVISKGADGQVTVTKTEKPTEHGGWLGLVAGATVAILMPVTAPAVIIGAGGAMGAAMGHAARGTNRGEAREVGVSLEPGHAALILVGLNGDLEKTRGALTRATTPVLQAVDGNPEVAAQRAVAALLNLTS